MEWKSAICPICARLLCTVSCVTSGKKRWGWDMWHLVRKIIGRYTKLKQQQSAAWYINTCESYIAVVVGGEDVKLLCRRTFHSKQPHRHQSECDTVCVCSSHTVVNRCFYALNIQPIQCPCPFRLIYLFWVLSQQVCMYVVKNYQYDVPRYI